LNITNLISKTSEYVSRCWHVRGVRRTRACQNDIRLNWSFSSCHVCWILQLLAI